MFIKYTYPYSNLALETTIYEPNDLDSKADEIRGIRCGSFDYDSSRYNVILDGGIDLILLQKTVKSSSIGPK